MNEPSRMFRLTPNTKRAKQIIQEHGDLWHCWRFDENLPCFHNGAGLLISPHGLAWWSNASRWIHATPDGRPNEAMFDVEEVG